MRTFDSYGALEEWAIENGYDADDFHDEEMEEGKHDYVYLTFYLHKEFDDTYAQVSASRSYQNGLQDISIEKEGLKRHVEQVTIEKVSYL